MSSLYIIQADASFLQEVAEHAIKEEDQSEVWKKIEAKADPASIKWLNTMKLETMSGLRSAIQARPNYLNSTEVSSHKEQLKNVNADEAKEKDHQQSRPEENSERATYAERRFAGAGMEIDPVIGSNGKTIDLNLNYQYHMAPPTFTEGQE